MRKRGSRCSAKAYSMSPLAGSGFSKEDGEKEKSGERALHIVWREPKYQDYLQRKSPETGMTLPLHRLINGDEHAVNVILHWQIPHTQLRVVRIPCIGINHAVLESCSDRK